MSRWRLIVALITAVAFGYAVLGPKVFHNWKEEVAKGTHRQVD